MSAAQKKAAPPDRDWLVIGELIGRAIASRYKPDWLERWKQSQKRRPK